MAYLEVKELEVFYGKARALSGVSFTVERGECVGVIGPNGGGKSTLLDSIMGLTNWRGKIIFDGVNLNGLSPSQIVKLKIGYSTERGDLFRFMNVKENLLVGGYCARRVINENLEIVLKLFPVLRERLKQETGTLSGGERQMLSLGRALMTNPKLLLLDEPTLGLAPLVIDPISEAIHNLGRMGATILIAEQNASFTLSCSDRIYLLERGGLVMGGTPEELKEDEYIRQTYFGL